MIRLLLILGFITTPPPQWQETDYEYFTAQTFFSREDVHLQIDLKNLDQELLNAAVFYVANEVREQKNKKTLLFDTHLKTAAERHSEAMNREEFIGHKNPNDKQLRTPMLRIENAGGNFRATAENIARVNLYILGSSMEYFINEKGLKVDRKGKALELHTYASLAHMVVDGWMHSKGHRENLMGDYAFLGCGVSEVLYSNQKMPEILITQNFGKK